MIQRRKILNMPVSSLNSDDILEKIEKDWKLPGKITTIYTPNAEIVTFGYFNSAFRQVVESFDLGPPDGTLVVWAGNMLGQRVQKRITGGQVMEQLVSQASKKNATIGLIGGQGGVAVLALECLKRKYPGLHGWSDSGPLIVTNENFDASSVSLVNQQSSSSKAQRHSQSEVTQNFIGDSKNSLQGEINRLAHKIVKTNTRFVFVALGCPKQEYFIQDLRDTIYEIRNKKNKLTANSYPLKASIVLMAVGGVFDVLAGKVKPAPQWMSSNGLEWLWRLLQEPHRIVRMLRLPLFVLLVLFVTLQKSLSKQLTANS